MQTFRASPSWMELILFKKTSTLLVLPSQGSDVHSPKGRQRVCQSAAWFKPPTERLHYRARAASGPAIQPPCVLCAVTQWERPPPVTQVLVAKLRLESMPVRCSLTGDSHSVTHRATFQRGVGAGTFLGCILCRVEEVRDTRRGLIPECVMKLKND